ncbi:aminoglycoside phosphotransferase family protein [Streptomyces sp. PTM05]|uniref:Aminoglycoside phosphotransferase family protein n=1 Tax=Streptantibioticus parmotrematis TaxID=2873249 RepID=A0ABS7QU02_9ACTN|nr:phosphotransferase [Streptantibioticus parmotrematis]MBY8886675.1 aminoglycoside phosphotransferase family protein [Streptantibioticus parmotrematis]
MITRVGWDELPPGLRASVEARTGKVLGAETVGTGLNCAVALTLTTTRNGTLFLKGVHKSDTAGLEGLRNEEIVNQTVAGIGPMIRHTFDVDGWYCLAFVYIQGRHADLGPGSADLHSVRSTVNRMRSLSGNSLWLARSGARIPRLSERLRDYLSAGDVAFLQGETLLHTDTNPHNIMVSTPGGEVYVIDWAMPALGPAWVDAACTAVRLMECGHEPASALEWLAPFPHWRQASPKAVEAFVNATCRQWSATVGEKDAEPSNNRFRALLEFPHEPPTISGPRNRA